MALVGIQSSDEPFTSIKLNAGPNYIMKQTDICFYMSIAKEENSSLMVNDDALNDDFMGKLSFKKVTHASTKISGGPKGKQKLTTAHSRYPIFLIYSIKITKKYNN